jgi:hypothetical protein
MPQINLERSWCCGLRDTQHRANMEKEHPIDFGVYKSIGDGTAGLRAGTKTISSIRDELVTRLSADGCLPEYFGLSEGTPPWALFPKFERLACYPADDGDCTGYRIHVDTITSHGECCPIFLGETSMGFEFACRAANACAKHLGS